MCKLLIIIRHLLWCSPRRWIHDDIIFRWLRLRFIHSFLLNNVFEALYIIVWIRSSGRSGYWLTRIILAIWCGIFLMRRRFFRILIEPLIHHHLIRMSTLFQGSGNNFLILRGVKWASQTKFHFLALSLLWGWSNVNHHFVMGNIIIHMLIVFCQSSTLHLPAIAVVWRGILLIWRNHILELPLMKTLHLIRTHILIVDHVWSILINISIWLLHLRLDLLMLSYRNSSSWLLCIMHEFFIIVSLLRIIMWQHSILLWFHALNENLIATILLLYLLSLVSIAYTLYSSILRNQDFTWHTTLIDYAVIIHFEIVILFKVFAASFKQSLLLNWRLLHIH